MLQLVRQTALRNQSESSERALTGTLSRQSTAPPSYRSRQNTIEATPSQSDSQISTPSQIVPARGPVAFVDTGAYHHLELRGNRITEGDDESSAGTDIPRRLPVPTPAAGARDPVPLRAIQPAGRGDERRARSGVPRRRLVPTPAAGATDPVLLHELPSAGRDDEQTRVRSEPPSAPPRSAQPRSLIHPQTSEHAPIQSSSASPRTSVPTEHSQEPLQHDAEPPLQQTKPKKKPKSPPAPPPTSAPTKHSQEPLQHDGEPRPQQTRPKKKPKSPPVKSGNPEQIARPTRQRTARQPDMAPYVPPGAGAPTGGTKPLPAVPGGNHPPPGGGRPPPAAGTPGLPPYSPSNPIHKPQGARGGQRSSNANTKLRQGAGKVARRLNSWDEKAQETSPYTAALMMTLIFAAIWGIGLLGFGIAYYHKFRSLPYEDLFFVDEDGIQVKTSKGGQKERYFIIVVMLAGAFVIKAVYILSILQAISKHKGWGLYRWAKRTQQAYQRRRDDRHGAWARQNQLEAIRHKREIGRGQPV